MLTRKEVEEMRWGLGGLNNGEAAALASLTEAMEALEHVLTALDKEAEGCAACAAAAELVAKWKGEK